jgi:hypothetical protein
MTATRWRRGAPDEDSLTTGINTVETGHSGRIGTLDDISRRRSVRVHPLRRH